MAIKIKRLPSDQFRAKGYKTTATPFFLIKTKKGASETARIGVVVGVAVHKSAAKRNFWKRQARAGLLALAPSKNDILMIVSPAVNRLTKKQFKEELSKTVAKIK